MDAKLKAGLLAGVTVAAAAALAVLFLGEDPSPPSIIPGGYYIPKVHSPMDKDFYPEKTALLIDGVTDYLQDKLSQP